jgi:hypothetical protein
MRCLIAAEKVLIRGAAFPFPELFFFFLVVFVRVVVVDAAAIDTPVYHFGRSDSNRSM